MKGLGFGVQGLGLGVQAFRGLEFRSTWRFMGSYE